jgi:hypothetical protein
MARDDEWGTRLADVRVPSWYGLGALVLSLAALIGELRNLVAGKKALVSVEELGYLLGRRAAESDRRDERMAELTERMESYGRTSVRLARASLAVAAAALAVAAVAAVAAILAA